jgi:hypothetical protein
MIVAVTAASGAVADDLQSVATGGPGGATYSDRCAPGEYLVGLSVHSGNWVDAVAAVCAPWVRGAGAFGSRSTRALRGGPGGNPGQFRCDPQSAIVKLFAVEAENQQHTVGLLAPRCATALKPDKQTKPATSETDFGSTLQQRQPQVDANGVGTSVTVDYDESKMPHCPSGKVAVGIYGGAGTYLDRIGLICDGPPISAGSVLHQPPSERRFPSAPPDRTSGSVTRPASSLGLRCKDGFVWREAAAKDLVCVTPRERELANAENTIASELVDPKGPYGPASCKSGFVWRDAFSDDRVCVTPERRDAVQQENQLGPSRTVL